MRARGVRQGFCDGLIKAGVSKKLVAKLEPYLGQKKENAQAALDKFGSLKLSQAEADELDNAIYQDHLKDARKNFDKDVDAANAADLKSGKTPKTKRAHFDNLPPTMQTVVMSTTYNMGAHYGASKHSKLRRDLWHNLIDNNGVGAEISLRRLGSALDNPHEHKGVRNRRLREANYLRGYNRKKSKYM